MKQWIAIMLSVIMALTLVGCSGAKKTEGNASLLTTVQYPETVAYPEESDYPDKEEYTKALDAWMECTERESERMLQVQEYAGEMETFFARSIPEFLKDTDGGNKVYSPLNVYMALAMLAETTDGSSRQQILKLLGIETVEELRKRVKNIWEEVYSNDRAISILADSVWMDADIDYKQEVLDILAENYYADAFQGKMGSKEYDKALQDWVNEKTGNLLADQALDLSFAPDTVLGLASTIYFQVKWSHEFEKEQTKQEKFHGVEGDITCEFMKQEIDQDYYWGDKFAAVAIPLSGNNYMWFILPDEGITPEMLLEEEQVMELLLHSREWENQEYLTVSVEIPKFDVQSGMDLKEGLSSLGVRDVFEQDDSDFTPLTEEKVFLSQVNHAVRTAIDEEGVTGAAYTVVQGETAGPPTEKKIDFVVDRPFLFVVTGMQGIPLFTGIVNEPG